MKTHTLQTLNSNSVEFLLNRYNRVNRWVIADMIRRSAYHHPDKRALIFGDKQMTYPELEKACNQTANALMDLGVKKYDRVAILAHNTIHHVLTWLGCCKAGAVYLAINYLLRGPDIEYCIKHKSTVFIVEEAIYLDSRVEEVAVIGVPHPKWVEAVTAVIVPRQGKTITEEEILELCRQKLSPFKVPKKIIFVDSLPKTPTGKLLKRDMRETYRDAFDKQ
jgi:acyl-CoA synthetase (AMP-forming)/AMP-acid ligase II